MKRSPTLPLVAVLVAALTMAMPDHFALAQDNDRSLFSIDPPESVDTRAFGISARGDIVGLYFTLDGRTHGFLLSRGRYSTIDVPGSIRTNALAINAHGDIVGRYDTPDTVAHGYVLSNGAFTTIDAPDATGFTVVTDISPSGHLVGRYRGRDGRFHGFSMIDGDFATIDHPDGIGIQGMAINPEDVIAGYYVDAVARFHGFLLDHGSFTTIDPPDSIKTGIDGGVLKINPAGDIAGNYTASGDVPAPCGCSGHGFVYRNGTFSSFDFPGAIATLNQGINPRGDIVGIYMDRKGRRHGFLAPRGTEEGK
jgi:hypothetical protein